MGKVIVLADERARRRTPGFGMADWCRLAAICFLPLSLTMIAGQAAIDRLREMGERG